MICALARHPLRILTLAVCAALAPAAMADEIERLETVTAQGAQDALPHTGGALVDRNTPQSEVSQEAIRELVTPFADYGAIVGMTPSFHDTAPNGEGFDAAKNQTLRGFADGQFNLTVDGVPVQDPDTFQHHSTSYFPAASLASVVVDRSPGGASDPGYATVGGTIQLHTLDLPSHPDTQVYASAGSFATTLAGARFASAAPQEAGDAGVLINAEHLQTAGALANADGRRDDVMLKGQWLATATVRVTGLVDFDRYHYNNPPSVDQAALARGGSAIGFGATPGLASYYGYSDTTRRTFTSYLRAEAELGNGWRLDDRLYRYYYASWGLGLQGDTTSSPVGSGKGVPSSDIALYRTDMSYDTVGNLLTLAHQDSTGTAKAGVWLDHSRERYERDTQDGTSGLLYNGARNHTPVYGLFTSHLDTVQPWVEYQWQATDRLEVRPGVRYQQVRRGLDASVIPKQSIGSNGEVSRVVTSTLPSLDMNWHVDENIHLLATVARGVQVPSQAFFYTATPGLSNQAAPQDSTAWQASLAYAKGGCSLALTGYLIDFQNYIATTTSGNGTVVSQNSGDVRYRGLELEGRWDLARGWALLGNASVIRGEYQQAGMASAAQHAGDDVPLVPAYLALAGALWREGNWQSSLIAHFIGSEYQGTGGSSNPSQRVEPWHQVDLTVSRFLGAFAGLEGARVTLGVNNLQDQASITDNGGPSRIASDGNQVNVQARRSYTLSFVGDF